MTREEQIALVMGIDRDIPTPGAINLTPRASAEWVVDLAERICADPEYQQSFRDYWRRQPLPDHLL